MNDYNMNNNTEAITQNLYKVCLPSTKHLLDHVDWTKQLDDYLSKTAAKYDRKNWRCIAAEMKDKFNNPKLTAKKCRERWSSHANPELSREPLSDL